MKGYVIEVYYNRYMTVPAEMIADVLQNCKLVSKGYGSEPTKYVDMDENFKVFEMELPSEEEPLTIDVEEVMAENNRLTRELDLLKASLNKSESTDLEVI